MKYAVIIFVVCATLACSIYSHLPSPPGVCGGYTDWWALGVANQQKTRLIVQSKWVSWFDPGVEMMLNDTIPVELWFERWSSGVVFHLLAEADTVPETVVLSYDSRCRYREQVLKDALVFWHIGHNRMDDVHIAYPRDSR